MSEFENAKQSIVITGGNSGLGYECAKALAGSNNNNYIVLACRRSEKTDQAVSSLIKKTGNRNISSIELDLSSLDSVRNFVKVFSQSKLPPLYAVVCNAGIQVVSGTQYTCDGIEMTFGVNHIGHFLLASMLLKYIREDGRIVFVSSDTHDPSQKTGMPEPVYHNAEWLAYPKKSSVMLSGTQRYTTSKLCNIYCAYEMAEQIKTQTRMNITVNAFNPGMMPGTGLARDYGFLLRWMWKFVLPLVIPFKRNVNTVKKSGKALASLITKTDLNDISGRYFNGVKETKSSDLSYDIKNRKELWAFSTEFVQLKQNETILSISDDIHKAF